jgi:hypothetical protein
MKFNWKYWNSSWKIYLGSDELKTLFNLMIFISVRKALCFYRDWYKFEIYLGWYINKGIILPNIYDFQLISKIYFILINKNI